MKCLLGKFIETFPPGDKLIKPTAQKISKYENILPDSILALWENYGFGNYGNGLIKIIDPEVYTNNLWGRLMVEEDETRIPIALSAFGDIFYYRQLSEDGDEDIAFIDPHISETAVLTWSLEDFFNDWCCDPETITEVLEKDLLAKSFNTTLCQH